MGHGSVVDKTGTVDRDKLPQIAMSQTLIENEMDSLRWRLLCHRTIKDDENKYYCAFTVLTTHI